MAKRFFDDDDGLVTLWFRGQQTLFREQAIATAAIATAVHEVYGGVSSVQRRIDHAIAATTNPTEQGHLIDVLMDDTPIPLAMVAAGGGFLRSNEPFEALLGFTKAELASMRWQDITPSQADIEADAATCSMIASGRIKGDRIEKTYRRKDGSTLMCALYLRRFPRVGEFRHFVCIIVPLQPDRQLR